MLKKQWLVWILAGFLAGCSSGDEPQGASGTGEPVSTDSGADPGTNAGSDSGGEIDTDSDTLSGLDERPQNPTCVAPNKPQFETSVSLESVFSGVSMTRPLVALQAPGDSSRWYVAEQRGRVLVFENRPDVSDSDVFLDIRQRVTAYNDSSSYYDEEQGLLGMAFDPNYATNGYFYVSYTRGGNPGTSVVSRFVVREDDLSIDASSEYEILTLAQPFANHNGGHIEFGPDGYLYIGFGDGGAGGDPYGYGQNAFSWLGTILRIDVHGGQPYAVPPDNPFVGGGGAPEIYAWGLRNPWRFHFDKETGDLWAGDVGQDEWEEIDVIRAGGNYGWKIREGAHCFNTSWCNSEGLMEPVAEYGDEEGQSVTGGYVYRGGHNPALYGVYLFADYVSGRMWGAYPTGDGEFETRVVNSNTNRSVASFAQDHDGELYILDLYSGMYRIRSEDARELTAFPELLSETGCALPSDLTQGTEGMIPYEPAIQFWSDSALKKRWLAIPDETSINLDNEGDFLFPEGTVLRKDFYWGDILLETRLFMRHPNGDWGGYSYAWSEDRSEATLVRGEQTATLSGIEWTWPSGAQCMQCHTRAANRSLGLEVLQLDDDYDYPNGRTANQLATLQSIGMVEGEASPGISGMPALTGDAPIEERARAYLHTNCSMCHRPNATGGGAGDLRFGTVDPNLCNIEPERGDLGVDDAKLVVPGHPERSVVPLRMKSTARERMPPVASLIVDDEGVALMEAWIESLEICQ